MKSKDTLARNCNPMFCVVAEVIILCILRVESVYIHEIKK